MPLPATRKALEALHTAPVPPRSPRSPRRSQDDFDEPKGEKHKASKVSARAADMEAKISALEAQVSLLLAERDASKAALSEAEENYASLRLMTSALKNELFGVREALDRTTKELKNEALLPLTQVRLEMQELRHESIALKAQLGVFEREIGANLSAKQEQAQQFQDVAVLRAQLGFVQAAADRADIASSEQSRVTQEIRTELAGVQQRHASLASSSAAEHNAHRQQHLALRSAVEANALAIEALQTAVGGLQANEGHAAATSEKLKKVCRRQEVAVQQQGETSEARASELRGLIKTVAEQLRPLHEVSRRHAAQIEEISSGINALAELFKFTNRNRSGRSLTDTLDAM